jgi:hypothetical protein
MAESSADKWEYEGKIAQRFGFEQQLELPMLMPKRPLLVLGLVHRPNHHKRYHNAYQAIFNDHHCGLIGKETANGFHPGSMGTKN